MKNGDLVQSVLDATGWSQAELSRQLAAVGVALSSDKINKALRGGRRLQGSEAMAISDLLDQAQKNPEARMATDEVHVPEFDVRASAGDGFIIDRETVKERWPFARSYLRELRISVGDAVIIEVGGDSMEPTLRSYDRIMIDTGDRNPARPGVFVLWDDGETVVKRLEKVPGTDPVRYRVSSDNPNHGTHESHAELINIVGRVVWVARRL